MKRVLLIIAISYLLFFHNIGNISLWDPDEPGQAIIAREMMQRDDYMRPYLNGEPYLEKPPLYPWLIVIYSKINGAITEATARIPAAASATMLLFTTYYLGMKIGNPLAGLFSAIVLATNYQFLSDARKSIMDMTFTFFIGLTILLNYICIEKNRRWYLALSFVPSALAILAKGPAGLIIAASTTFIYLGVKKRLRRFIVPFLAGCLIAVALAAIWFLLAGEGYVKESIIRQNIIRYAGVFEYAESAGYYFKKLFINFLPWSLILPFALYHCFKQKAWLPMMLPVIWFLFAFIFFEFSQAKKATHLLPLYPAIAIICGLFLQARWSLMVRHPKTNLILRVVAVIFACFPLAAITLLLITSNPVAEVFKATLIPIYLFSGLLFVFAIIFFYLLTRKEQQKAFFMLSLYLILIGYFYHTYYLPVMDKNYRSPRLITDELVELQEGREICTYGFDSPGIIFYSGRHIKRFTNIDEIKGLKNDILLIVADGDLNSIQNRLAPYFIQVKRLRYEKRDYLIYLKKRA